MATKLSTSHLTPHEAICDALYRNTQGIDDNNPALIASAFTVDAVQDMTACKFLSPFFGITQGREAIVGAASSTVGLMDTTHMLFNYRTQISDDGKSAHLTSYAMAQHWRPGHGKSYTFGNNFLMGNRYEGDLVFDGELWRFKRFTIKPQWTQGDFGVFDQESWPIVQDAVRGAV